MLDSLLNRVIALQAELSSGDIVRMAVLPYGAEILDMQREQLAEGKSGSGADLRPYYSEDLKPGGYFHSVQTARNYAAWKVSLGNPYEAGARNPDAPNLFITGKFYGEIAVNFGSDYAHVVGTTPWAAGIIAKYGAENFSLSRERWDGLLNGVARGRLMDEIKRVVYGS